MVALIKSTPIPTPMGKFDVELVWMGHRCRNRFPHFGNRQSSIKECRPSLPRVPFGHPGLSPAGLPALFVETFGFVDFKDNRQVGLPALTMVAAFGGVDLG